MVELLNYAFWNFSNSTIRTVECLIIMFRNLKPNRISNIDALIVIKCIIIIHADGGQLFSMRRRVLYYYDDIVDL